jgi:hypothetical protein
VIIVITRLFPLFILLTFLAIIPLSVSESLAQASPISDEKIEQVPIHKPVELTATVHNSSVSKLKFVTIFQIIDSDHIVVFLSTIGGVANSFTDQHILSNWSPENKGTYLIMTFILSDLTNPIILENVSSKTVIVTDNITPISDDGSGISQPNQINSTNSDDIVTKSNLTSNAPSLSQLREYALAKINEDRAKFGLKPVNLSTNEAAQKHAEDVLRTGLISHWMTNGEKPYMTYTRYGGTGDVGQNVALSGGNLYRQACNSGQYKCETTNPYKEIDDHEYFMINNDKKCCDDGHRDNILDKFHTHVSLGIAYDNNTFVLVQNFEDNYIQYNKPITNDNRTLEFSGKILPMNSMGSSKVSLVNIFYDPLPTRLMYEENKDRTSYDQGTFIGGVTPDRSYYAEGKTLLASRWDSGDSFDLEFDISPIIDKAGVYTVYVYLENSDSERFPVTSYSVVVNG